MRKKTKTRRKTNKRQVMHLIAFFTSIYAPLYCSFARRSKVRFAPILFFRKNKTIRTLPCSSSFRKKRKTFFARAAARPTTLRFRGGPEADRRRWRRKGGEGRLAKGRNASGSEQCDHFASWTKAGKSEQMESRPPPEAEGGRRRALGKREEWE